MSKDYRCIVPEDEISREAEISANMPVAYRSQEISSKRRRVVTPAPELLPV